MRRHSCTRDGLLAALAACAVVSAGCVVHPASGRFAEREPSVTDDVLSYLEREWPLEADGVGDPASDSASGTAGDPVEQASHEDEFPCGEVVSDESCRPAGCGLGLGLGLGGRQPIRNVGARLRSWVRVPGWINGTTRPGTIPAGAGPPGRFFPVPVSPPFAPQGEQFFGDPTGPMGS
ncbi:MAG: hypothetical protein ACRCT8_05870 [Lacipirellulaceae bacterium]